MKQRKPKTKQIVVPSQSEKGHLFGKKNKVSVWASQIPYEDIPDSYFEERFFKNNTRASNQWTDNYQIRYFRPDDLETNGVAEGLGDVKAVAGACSFSHSFILPLMSKARKKKLTEVSWLILLYEYEYAVKISGIESDDVTTFLGAFDYRDDAENIFEAEARIAAELLANPPEVPVEAGFTFARPAPKAASSIEPKAAQRPSVAPKPTAEPIAVPVAVPKIAEKVKVAPVAAPKVAEKAKAEPVVAPVAVPKVAEKAKVAPVAASTAADKPKVVSVAVPRVEEAPVATPNVEPKPKGEPQPVVAVETTEQASAPVATPTATKKKSSFSFAKKAPKSE